MMNERVGGMSEQLRDFFKHWVRIDLLSRFEI
jgi:hypothetical protein